MGSKYLVVVIPTGVLQTELNMWYETRGYKVVTAYPLYNSDEVHVILESIEE